MKKSILLPLVIVTVTGTLTSCTDKSENNPTVSSESTVTGTIQSGATQGTTETMLTKTGIASYNSPAGLDTIEFSITHKDGVITAASAKPLATHPGSVKNQGNFAKEVESKVVGKSIKNFDVEVIGGASLTTGAFKKFVQSL